MPFVKQMADFDWIRSDAVLYLYFDIYAYALLHHQTLHIKAGCKYNMQLTVIDWNNCETFYGACWEQVR